MAEKKTRRALNPVVAKRQAENEFTQKEIDAFQAECGKRPQFSLPQFYAVLKKKPEDLTYKDVRILISKTAMLSDNERYKFRHILVFENLTASEEKSYRRVYPERTGGGKFDRYFPKRNKIDEVYEEYFVAGRTVAETPEKDSEVN